MQIRLCIIAFFNYTHSAIIINMDPVRSRERFIQFTYNVNEMHSRCIKQIRRGAAIAICF